MRRNLFAGRRRSEGVNFDVLTSDDLQDIHAGTLEGPRPHRRVRRGRGGPRGLRRRGRRGGRSLWRRAHPPARRGGAIRTAPSQVVLCGRSPRNDVVLQPGRVGFTNFGEGVKVVDPYTGELRVPTKADVGLTAKVVDYLPNVDVYERAITAMDVPQDIAPLHQAEAWFTNTSKHGFMGSGESASSRRSFSTWRPPSSGAGQAAPPAHHLVHHLSGQPAEAGAGHLRDHHDGGPRRRRRQHPQHGHGRRLVAGHARRYAGDAQRRGAGRATLSQLTQPGAAVVYGSSTTAMDLRLAAASVGSPECGLISAAVAQIARFYLLPSWVAGA